jgi:AmiR/NasT family two-component response regulator
VVPEALVSVQVMSCAVQVMSCAVIEQAKAILMERYKITEDQAFTLLTHASQHTNVKLRVLADQRVRTDRVAVTPLVAET